MKEFAYEHAPDGIAGTRSVHDFVDTVMQTWSVVRDSIPQSVLMAATTPPQRHENTYLSVGDTDLESANYYVRVHIEEGGQRSYRSCCEQ